MGQWHFKDVVNASKNFIGYAFSRQSLNNSLSDLSETVAHAQQRTDLETAFKKARYQDTSRYQENFWLSAYQTLQNDMRYGLQKCQDIANVCVAMNDGAETLVAQVKKEVNESSWRAKMQAQWKQAGQHLSEHPWLQKMQKSLQEGIGEELWYVGYELGSQKELLLDSLRGLVNRNDLPSIDYFIDTLVEEVPAENTVSSEHNPRTHANNPNFQSTLQKGKELGNYAWQRARQDSRFLAERLGYLVLDSLEMEAQQNNPQLAETLAEIRQQGTHRVATHQLSNIAEAASILMTTIQEQSRQLRQMMAESPQSFAVEGGR